MKKALVSASIFCLLAMFDSQSIQAQVIDDPEFQNSQPKDNSPYSRLGFGNMVPQQTTVSGTMGGQTAAFRDELQSNPYNPASFSALRSTAFEIGLGVKRSELSGGSSSYIGTSGELGYLSLAFNTQNSINEALAKKIKKVHYGMGFHLTPYNNVAYIVETVDKDPTNDTATVSTFYLGNGTTYKLMYGASAEYKGLSVGASAGYLFGKITNNRQAVFNDLGYASASLLKDDYSLRGFVWNVGMQYTINLDTMKSVMNVDKKGKKRLVIGVYSNPSTSFTTTSSSLYQTVRIVSAAPNRVAIYDTTFQSNNKKGNGMLPTEITGGVMYEEARKLRIGVEYAISKWSEYRNSLNYDNQPQVERLKDAYRISAGIEYTPNINAYNRYSSKVRYRVGYRMGTDGRQVQGKQLGFWAVSAGVGMPIIVQRQQNAIVNFGLEYGNFGIMNDKSVINDRYLKLNVGFTLNDNSWFLKRKYQ